MEKAPYESFVLDSITYLQDTQHILQSIVESFQDIYVYPLTYSAFLIIVALVVLLLFSALISGSEVAFFSITLSDQTRIKEKSRHTAYYIDSLRSRPRRLMATILSANAIVNIAIIILSTYLVRSIFDFSQVPWLGFILVVLVVILLLLVFGEIIPRIYAAQYKVRFASFMAYTLLFLERVLRPVSLLLITVSSVVDRRLTANHEEISINELPDAIDIAGSAAGADKEILERIVRYVNIEAREIMRPRIDVVALEYHSIYSEVMHLITLNPYSRIPVYNENFDNIAGVLYVKDLINHLEEPDDFKWQNFLKEPYFIPENKNINELLTEFQSEKKHMAVVVDEYGGTQGIVTLEDVLEEIMGDITDESDLENEATYSKLRENEYSFNAKTLLNDFYKIMELPEDYFDTIKGDAETLAGLMLEIKQGFPEKDEQLPWGKFLFIIEEKDKRRIKKIRVKILPEEG